jgi:hypothetical protein
MSSPAGQSGGNAPGAPGGAGPAGAGAASSRAQRAEQQSARRDAAVQQLAAARTAQQEAVRKARDTAATLAGVAPAAGAPHTQAQQAAAAAQLEAEASTARVRALEQAAASGDESSDGGGDPSAVHDASDDEKEEREAAEAEERAQALREAVQRRRAERAAAAAQQAVAQASGHSPEQEVTDALAHRLQARLALSAAQAGDSGMRAAAEAAAHKAEQRVAAAFAAASAEAEQQLGQRAAQRAAQQAGTRLQAASPGLAGTAVRVPGPFVAGSAVGVSSATGPVNHAQLSEAMQVMRSVPLSLLTSADASKPGALEDWLYQLRNVLEVAGVTDFATQLKVLGVRIDRQLATWLTGATALARANGVPLRSMDDVAAAMRSQFTPQSDEDTARRELIKIRQRDGETMEAYVARAQELYNRVSRARLPSEMAGEALLDGVDGRRFVLTVHGVRQAQQTNRTLYGGSLPFESVRAQLVANAVNEPQLWAAPAQQRASSSGAGGSSKAAYRSPSSKASSQQYGAAQQHINYVGAPGGSGNRYASLGGGTVDDEGADSDAHGLNAVDMADVLCYRCQTKGHYAADCSKPDTRVCNKCKKKGHLKRDCRSTKKADGTPIQDGSAGGGEGQAAQAGAQQKNGEARG